MIKVFSGKPWEVLQNGIRLLKFSPETGRKVRKKNPSLLLHAAEGDVSAGTPRYHQHTPATFWSVQTVLPAGGGSLTACLCPPAVPQPSSSPCSPWPGLGFQPCVGRGTLRDSQCAQDGPLPLWEDALENHPVMHLVHHSTGKSSDPGSSELTERKPEQKMRAAPDCAAEIPTAHGTPAPTVPVPGGAGALGVLQADRSTASFSCLAARREHCTC